MTTAAHNLRLIIPRIRWLGVRFSDLLKHHPPATDKAIEDLLKKPWFARNPTMQGYIRELSKSTGGITDMGLGWELVKLLLGKIENHDYIRMTSETVI